MLIFTARVRRGPIIAAAAAAAAVCLALRAGSFFSPGRRAAAAAAVDPTGVRTNEDRVAYLERYGWVVSDEPVSVEELIIPEVLDDSYSQYLELQASQGFDLTACQGKRVKRYGWVVSDEPVSVEELIIPEVLDDSYSQYLELQASQGFDLTACQGKRVKRYTYQVANYPSGEGEVLANLLIRKNTVVGGEVLSAQPGGFIHGLEQPGAS